MDISVKELHELLESGESVLLVDVREPYERAIADLGGLFIPMRELPDRLEEIEEFKTGRIVVYCRSGARSSRVVHWLRTQGFVKTFNLKGGLLAWREEVDPTLPEY